MARDRKRQQDTDLQERVVYIHRVSKTVKGGRRMSLVALVVVETVWVTLVLARVVPLR